MKWMQTVMFAACMMVGAVQAHAQAQTQQSPGTAQMQQEAQAQTAQGAGSPASVPGAEVAYHDPVNTGRTTQMNTKGCVGPASWCNLYFGS
jgi:hypothetical protein